MDFQTIIAKLSEFWAQRGCLTWYPYDLEKGAGTFNPATFLRALGPEPWRVAYVEPCRRPTDGRFGENPNRFQHYYQFQVILKPAPEDAQQLYIDSLAHLGIDLAKHDFRFVEDDWEQPSVGAAGLGWEVWLDGQEVSQYTYFQQVGGVELDPMCVEYTYGLERLATLIQGKDSGFDIVWLDGDDTCDPPRRAITYGDVHHADEVQFSAFNFDHADTSRLFRWFDDYEAQAKDLLKVSEENDAAEEYDPRRCLVMPAYDFVMKASHAFNLLDARNAISVDQRAMYINRIRKLAKRVAHAYLAHRKALGHPLLGESGKAAESATKKSAGKPAPKPEPMPATEAKPKSASKKNTKAAKRTEPVEPTGNNKPTKKRSGSTKSKR